MTASWAGTGSVYGVFEVVDGSVIGESAFCPGGKTSGGSTGATITATFLCPGGRLTVSYSPAQWENVIDSSAPIRSVPGSNVASSRHEAVAESLL